VVQTRNDDEQLGLTISNSGHLVASQLQILYFLRHTSTKLHRTFTTLKYLNYKYIMPVKHIPKISTENWYQKDGTINRHKDRALSCLLSKTGTVPQKFGTDCMSDVPETDTVFLVPVFGTDFWYVCHWH